MPLCRKIASFLHFKILNFSVNIKKSLAKIHEFFTLKGLKWTL